MDEFEQAAREGDFITSILEARDTLKPVITGEIERGHCVGERECYGGRRGMRKTKLADAMRIAKTVEVILNRAVNKFDRGD